MQFILKTVFWGLLWLITVYLWVAYNKATGINKALESFDEQTIFWSQLLFAFAVVFASNTILILIKRGDE